MRAETGGAGISTAMQELRTTIQVPLNQPVLVGGMTIRPALPTQGGQPFPGLYLVIEVAPSE